MIQKRLNLISLSLPEHLPRIFHPFRFPVDSNHNLWVESEKFLLSEQLPLVNFSIFDIMVKNYKEERKRGVVYPKMNL